MEVSVLALISICIVCTGSYLLKDDDLRDVTIIDDVTRVADDNIGLLLDQAKEDLGELGAVSLNKPVKKKKQGNKKKTSDKKKKPDKPGENQWPAPEEHTKCSQTTKQKAMYAKFSMTPPLRQEPATEVNLKVTWNIMQGAPWTSSGKGGTYAAYTVGIQGAQGGYFGSQLSRKANSKTGYRHNFIFSIWDKDRWVKGSDPRQFKPSNSLAWPMGTNCKRNCQDCGKTVEKGLTTGAQCGLPDPDANIGVTYEFTLKRTEVNHTIDTRDYGGMPKAHAKYGEKDRNITGDVWEVTARNDQSMKSFSVGVIMFEGATGGLYRLGVFDEMLGCNRCNDIYHKDTRTVPIIDGDERRITGVSGVAKASSTCKKENIQGIGDRKWIFEGGPGYQEGFPIDGKYHNLDI